MQTFEFGGRRTPAEAVEIRERRPGDEAAYSRFEQRLDPEDIRLRFGQPVRPRERRAHDLAIGGEEFIALDREGEIIGAARLVDGEVALIVRSDMKRRGIGTALLGRIVERANETGIPELRAIILSENRPMLRLACQAGFRFEARQGTAYDMRMRLPSMRPLACAPQHRGRGVRTPYPAAGGRHG